MLPSAAVSIIPLGSPAAAAAAAAATGCASNPMHQSRVSATPDGRLRLTTSIFFFGRGPGPSRHVVDGLAGFEHAAGGETARQAQPYARQYARLGGGGPRAAGRGSALRALSLWDML